MAPVIPRMEKRLNETRLETGIIFSYFLVSLLILYPLLPHLFNRLSFASNGDIRLSLTILFSNLKKITQGDLLNLFQLPILFPLSHTLTAGINLFGQTLLVLPFYLIHIRNVYIIYNLLTFISYIAAGYCSYRFAREWVEERWIAWIVGALYILLPFRVHNIPHLNLLFSFPIPLTLLFFSRFLKRGQTKDLLLFTFAFFSQFLFDLSLGLFLGISLGMFFLVRQILFGLMPWRYWVLITVAAVLFLVSVTLIFLPYMSPKTSFSVVDEIHSIPPGSFSTSVSFYSNWSYLLLFFNRIFWNQSPRCPGLTIFIFFILAFMPYLKNFWEKTLALTCSFFLIVPALVFPIIFQGGSSQILNRVSDWALLLFLFSLSLLLYVIREKTPKELQWLAITWLLLQFYSSQISLPFFNLFQSLARLFPFLLRSRGIRTEYVLLLLFFTVSAFGFSYFFKRFRQKKIVLALALVLVFAERIRWPVYPERLDDDRPVHKEFYRLLDQYPDHFGLLELPAYPNDANHYSLFTIYHHKHTYDGHIYYLGDYYGLSGHPQLQVESGFSGLSDPSFSRMLAAKGIRLIMLFKHDFQNEDRRTWHIIQSQIRLGEMKGLFEKVERNRNGTLLVLCEREQGPRIRYFLPYYALKGKNYLVCTTNVDRKMEAEFLFNGNSIHRQLLVPGSRSPIVLDIGAQPREMQFNYLEIRSAPSLELVKVRIE